jgi:hypothetical protein
VQEPHYVLVRREELTLVAGSAFQASPAPWLVAFQRSPELQMAHLADPICASPAHLANPIFVLLALQVGPIYARMREEAEAPEVFDSPAPRLDRHLVARYL